MRALAMTGTSVQEAGVREAALRLPGVRMLKAAAAQGDLPEGMGAVRHATCALVGNSAGVLKGSFGQYINAHEVRLFPKLVHIERMVY